MRAPAGDPIGKPLPAVNVPFNLPAGGSTSLWFPSFPTGSQWYATVNWPPDYGTYSAVFQY